MSVDRIQINITSEDTTTPKADDSMSNNNVSQPPKPPSQAANNKLQQIAQQARNQRSTQMMNLSSSLTNSSGRSAFGLPSRGLTSTESSNAPEKSNSLLVGTFPAMNSPQRMDAPGGGPRRQKTRLDPGHSAMDWESLKKTNSSNTKMRGGIDPSSFPLRVSRDELKKHNKREDCWISLGSKVYDITMYLKFHPGGAEILIKSSGCDATSLFNKYHRWVNFERILDGCLVGFLV